MATICVENEAITVLTGRTSMGKTTCFTRFALPRITVAPLFIDSWKAIQGMRPERMYVA